MYFIISLAFLKLESSNNEINEKIKELNMIYIDPKEFDTLSV